MAHFRSEYWVDFARDVIDPEVKQNIERHLAAGCRECVSASESWIRMTEFAAKDTAFEPPADAVRVAKEHTTLVQNAARGMVATVVAALVSDSWASPSHVGVRSLNSAPRHMLFRSGPLSIDLRVQPAARSEQIVLVGQLMDNRCPDGHVRAALDVISGETKVTGTVANKFGEFALEFEHRTDLVLSVVVPDQWVKIPLDFLPAANPPAT